MKKIILMIVITVLMCFLLPIIFTTKFKNIEIGNDVQAEEVVSSVSIYKYEKFASVKVLHTKSGEIEEIPLDEYLYGVVSAEMPANYEEEALKAQAIVARTYTIYKILNNKEKHIEADICDDSTCCQAWISKEDRLNKWEEDKREDNWNKIVRCVDTTFGKIITYEGNVINAFFHANSGGTTELPINVWGGEGFPYLQAVQTSGEEAYSGYLSNIEYTYQEVIDKIKEFHKELEVDFSKEDSIEILEYTDSGRIKTIRFGNVNLSGIESRKIFGLKSAKFEIKNEGGLLKFNVIGYGHGVGLSQNGADSMAKEGKKCEDIINHYYSGIEIKELNIM